ncbi:hypothetical protein OROHE_001146 [Orobanche hederae]
MLQISDKVKILQYKLSKNIQGQAYFESKSKMIMH